MTTGPGFCSDGIVAATETVAPAATLTRSIRQRLRGRVPFTAVCLLLSIGFCMELTPRRVVADEPASGITNAQADAILKELKSIRELLERMDIQQARLAPPASAVTDSASISIKNRPALGAPDAPVTVVEFTDYECPFCKRFHQTTFKSLRRDYIDNGKVRWVVLDLPLPMHPNATKAAQVAHCAGEQDKFWEMRKVLFDNAPMPEPEVLNRHGKQLSLDEKLFDDCLANDRHLDQIAADSASAAGIRITGTPSFIIGKSDGDRVEGKKIIGAQSYAVFDSAIRLALQEASPETD